MSAANISVDAVNVLAIVIEETGGGALSWNADFNSSATYAGGTIWSLFNGDCYEYKRDGTFDTYVDPTDIPEPSVIALFDSGIVGQGFVGRLRNQP